VARQDGLVVGYGGMWMMADEAHITTFAVAPDRRRQRLGERLLLALLDLASAFHAHEATLEVRLSNLPARRLYEKYGFRPVGLRPRYYSDDNEDALIMTTEPLASAGLRQRIDRLRRALAAEDLARDSMPAREPGRDDARGSDGLEPPGAGGGPNVPGSTGPAGSGGRG